MQKEDLIKRMRLFVTLTTVAFVVLIVTLLIQFGFIAHYNTERKRLEDERAAIQAERENLSAELAYIKGEYAKDHAELEALKNKLEETK